MINFKTVLVAKDFSDASDTALKTGIRLARATGAALHVLHVQVLHEDTFRPNMGQDRAKNLAEALDLLIRDAKDISVTQAVVRDISAAYAIVKYAEDHASDFIVVGTHGRRGFRHAVLGSVAEEVVRRANCAVLTVRSEERDPSGSSDRQTELLLPIDFSTRSAATIPVAREIAAAMHARLHVLHVSEEAMYPSFYSTGAFSLSDFQPEIEVQALAHLKALYAPSSGPIVPVEFEVISGQAVTEIVARAAVLGADMIVMSTHGLSGFAHFFMGSVAERVVRLATCPVLTLRLPSSVNLARGVVGEPPTSRVD